MSLRLGVLWSALQGVGGRALQFITGIVMARLLVPEDFGLIVTVQVFTGIAGLVAGGGIMQALVRQQDCCDTDLHTGFTVQLLIAALLYLLFFFAVAPLAAEWLDDPRYLPLIRVSALGFFVRPFWNSASTRLQRDMRFKILAIDSLWSIVVGSTVSITMALTGYGVWSLVFGGLAGSVTNSLLNSFAARWWPRFALSTKSIRGFYRAGSSFAFINIVHHVSNKGVALAISKIMGPAPLGIFNKGQSLAIMPNDLAGASLHKPLFRAMAREREDQAALNHLFTKAIVFMACLTWPALALLAWYSESLIVFLYGENWRAAGPVLQIFAISAFFGAISRPSEILLTTGSGLQTYIWVLTLGALATVSTAVFLSSHSIVAVSIGIAIVQILRIVAAFTITIRHHAISMKPIMAGLVTPTLALIGLLIILSMLGSEVSPMYISGWKGNTTQVLLGIFGYMIVILSMPNSLAHREIKQLISTVRNI